MTMEDRGGTSTGNDSEITSKWANNKRVCGWNPGSKLLESKRQKGTTTAEPLRKSAIITQSVQIESVRERERGSEEAGAGGDKQSDLGKSCEQLRKT